MGTYGNVGIVTRTCVCINPVEPSVEKVVEALMDAVCLTHDNSVAFRGRMTDSSYSVDLAHKINDSITLSLSNHYPLSLSYITTPYPYPISLPLILILIATPYPYPISLSLPLILITTPSPSIPFGVGHHQGNHYTCTHESCPSTALQWNRGGGPLTHPRWSR